MEKKADDLGKLYANLGVILDGIWYLEAEKRIGFEKAYEIDEAVWKIYPEKEAKRIKTFLGIDTPNAENIKEAIGLSLFNKTLKFDIIEITKTPLTLHFRVYDCRSLSGMKKGGRSDEQILKICKGIGLVFFESFLKVFDPKVEIKPIYLPTEKETEKNISKEHVCVWEFILPNIK